MLMAMAAFGLSLVVPIAAAADTPPTIPYEKYKLANGLEVILSQDRSLPIVAVNLWYHVGAANEETGRTGFAHLFEHMMFAGSKHAPRGLADKLLEAAGVTDSNASTSFDRTNYFDTVPSNQLELALWSHADRMGYLLDALDQAALTNQQDVVRNERRQSTENRPYGIVDEAIFRALFPPGHPYRPFVIGSHVDIQAARIADVRDFFKRYYRPNNATLVIVGDFETATAKRLVQKQFGSFRRGTDVPAPNVATPALTTERRFTVTDQIELERVDLSWLTPPMFKPGDAELTIAASILAGGKASRLYQKLVYELQVAQDVSATQDSFALTSIFGVQALARAGRTGAELQPLVDAEIVRLATEGPTVAEVERARNQIERSIYQGLQKVGGRADQLNLYNQYLGDPGFLPKDIERYNRVTAADVQRAVRELLPMNARVVTLAVRGDKVLDPDPPAPPPLAVTGTESINADEAWRNRPPKPGPARVPVLPAPQSYKLANGLTVLHFQRPAMPIATAQLVVNAGLASGNSTQAGVPDFALSLLDDGTATRNSRQIAEQFEQLGAAFDATTRRDTSVLGVDGLSRNFAEAMALLADVAQHPTFPVEEIERKRQSRLSDVASATEQPGLLANVALARALFGAANPLGVSSIGTEKSIKQTTQAELRDWWQRQFRPQAAALVVVGAIEPATLRALVEREWGTWKPVGDPPAVTAPAPVATTAARAIIIDKPNAPQTEVRVGRIGAARSTPDYPALQVINYALGGGFTSRINLNLREDKGYTYGAGSRFDFGRNIGTFAVSTAVRSDVSAQAITEIEGELKRAGSAPFAAPELAKARGALTDSLPGRFETNGATTSSFADLFAYGLSLDYYQRLPAQFSAVNATMAEPLARRYFDPAKMVLIAVGDRTTLEAQLKKLGLDPIEVWPVKGTLF
ncbi:MAG: pitrilysin family protein [Casimicrobiaceae bacterium]